MRYWFDTEFNEDGYTIKLISIGVVAEDGREYYAEVAGAKKLCSTPWLAENVLPHLTGDEKRRVEIAADLLDFIEPGANTQLWAYWGAYDWVVLCQLYGRMMDIPAWPYFRDLQDLRVNKGYPALPQQEGAQHNALADARYNKLIWTYLTGGRNA